MKKMDRWKV